MPGRLLPSLIRLITAKATASSESAAGFFDTSVAEAFAEFEGGGEALAAQFALAELQVREAAKVGRPPFPRHIHSLGVRSGPRQFAERQHELGGNAL